jgi:hypothetical protein
MESMALLNEIIARKYFQREIWLVGDYFVFLKVSMKTQKRWNFGTKKELPTPKMLFAEIFGKVHVQNVAL